MIGSRTWTACVAVLLVSGFAVAQEEPKQEEPKKKPSVEVVFVLDTTGSMGGLIAGAKKKIWSIANTIGRGKPTPDLKVGLVAYRDKGDDYVTRIFPLTDNLDAVYAELQEYRADGGGDGPENVRQALQDALTRVKWTRESRTLKIIFLVGDAPPHMDYKDVKTVDELCELAAKSEVILNTVRCGGNQETGRIWQQIARKAEGKYFSIDQSGGVVAVATPFDKELGTLSDRLGETMVAYGGKKARDAAKGYAKSAKEMDGEEKADRAGTLGFFGRLSTDDLIDAIREKRVKLEDIKTEHLPKEMQDMTLEQKKAYLEKKRAEREKIRKQILELSRKRDAYIDAELRKSGMEDGFDQVVKEALREQAEKVGVTIENEHAGTEKKEEKKK